MTDRLTTAYVAIGAARMIDVKPPDNWDEWNGELGFIDMIVQHADALDEAGLAAGEKIGHVVWCYEIAEEFGARAAGLMLEGAQFDPAVLIANIIQEAEDSQ